MGPKEDVDRASTATATATTRTNPRRSLRAPNILRPLWSVTDTGMLRVALPLVSVSFFTVTSSYTHWSLPLYSSSLSSSTSNSDAKTDHSIHMLAIVLSEIDDTIISGDNSRIAGKTMLDTRAFGELITIQVVDGPLIIMNGDLQRFPSDDTLGIYKTRTTELPIVSVQKLAIDHEGCSVNCGCSYRSCRSVCLQWYNSGTSWRMFVLRYRRLG